jgi:hypothetical protein
MPSKLILASKVTFFPQLRGTLANARSACLDQAYRVASEMLVPISSTNTTRSVWGSCPATKARPRCPQELIPFARTHRPFSTPPQVPQHPAHGRVAHPNARRPLQELAPLGEGGRGAPLHVSLQELRGTLVHLRLGAGSVPRGEGEPLVCQLGVALDRRTAQPEGASGLTLGCARSEGFDYLLSWVFRIGVHGAHDATWTICVANYSRGCLRSPNRLVERASRDYVRPFSLPFLVLFPPQK